MNQEAARVSSNQSFRRKSISFEKIPQQSKLFLDFLKNDSAVNKFYPEKNTPLDQFAEKVLENYRVDRNALCDALTTINQNAGSGAKTFENIELLRDADCLTIVTGQQAGLFSGAIYTIYKALSAVRFAADLRKQNIKAVPVFWIAEEDHDFDEIKKTYILDEEGKLSETENTPENLVENAPVGAIKFDETLKLTLQNLFGVLFGKLPRGGNTFELKNILSKTYQPGETFSTAFAKFVAAIFQDYGLIILSPLDANLKKLCAPIFAEAVEKSSEIVAALLEKNDELERENYQPQVLVEKDSFPFFYQNENGARQALRTNADNGKVKVQKSRNEFETSELAEIARTSPQNLSPNALLRPVVQDYLLPTLTYFGGAAEIAYFAQNSAIYKVLNRPVTPIRHRASLTIIEPKHARTMEKYALDLTDLFAGKEKIESAIVEKFISGEVAHRFDLVEAIIAEQLNMLGESLKSNEITLAANLETRGKKILWHIDALRKKYHRAELLKDETIRRRIETLFVALLPHDALQERTLNVATFLSLYGKNFVEWVYEAIELDEQRHQILYL